MGLNKLPSSLKNVVRNCHKPTGSNKRRKTLGAPKIEILNSYCQITGISNDVFDLVEKTLTYHNEEAKYEKINALRMLKYARKAEKYKTAPPWLVQKMNSDGIEFIEDYVDFLQDQYDKAVESENPCLLSADGYFPTGLLPRVLKTLQGTSEALEIDVIDLRNKPVPKIRYKWKTEPFEARYYQGEMIDIAEYRERGVYEASVASGKTFVMANLTFQKRVPTLIVLPSRPLVGKTIAEFQDWFGKTKVQHVTTDILKKGAKLKPIRLVTIQTLAALQKNGLIKKLVSDVDMILLDEFHHAGSTTYQNLLKDIDHVYYRYGFTGTFLRNDSKTMDMYGFLSEVLYHYPPRKALEDGFITPTTFKIFPLAGKYCQKYQTEYRKNYCGSAKLLNKIAEIVKGIPKGEQILILTKQKEKSGELIKNHLKKQGISLTYISGDDKPTEIDYAIEKFNKKEINILLGTKVIGEGIDVHSTVHLILATGGKSGIEIPQAIGRAVRLHPGKTMSYVYDFDFVETKYLTKHLVERVGMYEEQFAGEIQYLKAA